MYKKGLLSVCCLGYKHAAFAAECIKSIWNNDYKNIEIIACDDGSNDGTIEILKELQVQSPCPFEIIEQENTANIGMNFNRCTAKAQGEFITYIALDDFYTEDAFSTKLNIMQQDEKIAFIYSAHINIKHEDGSIKANNTSSITKPTIDELYEKEYNNGTFALQGNIFRKEIVDIVNGFDEDLLGDDIILRTKIIQFMYKNRNWSFEIVNTPAVIYRRHDNNISKNGTRLILTHLQCYDRYWKDKDYPKFMLELFTFFISQFHYSEFLKIAAKHPRLIETIANNDDFALCIRCNMEKNLKPKKLLYNIAHYEKKRMDKTSLVIFNKIKIGLKRR